MWGQAFKMCDRTKKCFELRRLSEEYLAPWEHMLKCNLLITPMLCIIPKSLRLLWLFDSDTVINLINAELINVLVLCVLALLQVDFSPFANWISLLQAGPVDLNGWLVEGIHRPRSVWTTNKFMEGNYKI